MSTYLRQATKTVHVCVWEEEPNVDIKVGFQESPCHCVHWAGAGDNDNRDIYVPLYPGAKQTRAQHILTAAAAAPTHRSFRINCTSYPKWLWADCGEAEAVCIRASTQRIVITPPG